MNNKVNLFFRDKKDYGAIFIRLIIGFNLIYGVFDNVIDWSRMLEFKKFLGLRQFPMPLACAVISVYAQMLCGIFYIIGAFIRMAAMVMIFNFIIAVTVHIGDTYANSFPALMMLAVSLFLLFNGAGKLSVDERVK